MKKTLFVIVMAFIGSQSMAQIQSGSIFFTGFGSIATTTVENKFIPDSGPTITTDGDKKLEGTFGLGGGYFLSDNIAVGISFELRGSKMTPPDTSKAEERMAGFGAGVFARYYVPMSDNFYFFGQLGYSNLATGTSETQGGTETEGPKTFRHSFGIRPGFTFFPASRIGLDLTFGNIGWSTTKTTEEFGGGTIESRSSGLDISFDMTTVVFGIQYFFGQ